VPDPPECIGPLDHPKPFESTRDTQNGEPHDCIVDEMYEGQMSGTRTHKSDRPVHRGYAVDSYVIRRVQRGRNLLRCMRLDSGPLESILAVII
jgi:hypothetical protein